MNRQLAANALGMKLAPPRSSDPEFPQTVVANPASSSPVALSASENNPPTLSGQYTEEESKFIKKYGRLPGHGKTAFAQKKIKDRKYFDSGDYVLAQHGKTTDVGHDIPTAGKIHHLAVPNMKQKQTSMHPTPFKVSALAYEAKTSEDEDMDDKEESRSVSKTDENEDENSDFCMNSRGRSKEEGRSASRTDVTGSEDSDVRMDSREESPSTGTDVARSLA